MLVGQRSEYWPDKYPCYSCEAQAHGCLVPEVSEAAMAKLIITDVTPQEAFSALNGLGTPEEGTCCEEVVVPLFTQLGIVVKGRRTRGTRYLIDELTFPDGTRLFLGASPQGAVAYRVAKKHSYVKALEPAHG